MKKIIITYLSLLITVLTFSQKAKVIKGDIKLLRDIKNFTVVFDYSNVNIPNYDTEELFLKEKVDLREKKEKGLGEKFRKEWFENRKIIYEPFFEKSFNKWYNKKHKTITNNSKYILKVEITNLFSGFNVIAVNQYAKISAVFTVYKKDDENNIIFKGSFDNIKGGKSYKLSKRLSVAYYNLAKSISIYIKRKSK